MTDEQAEKTLTPILLQLYWLQRQKGLTPQQAWEVLKREHGA